MPVVSVAGASGYAGGELLRLIAGHPQLQLGPVTAGSRAGERIAVVHPHLVSLGDRLLLETSAEVLAEADLVFLALPHGESANLVARLPASLKIVDLGADFRLRDSLAWQNYYGGTHAGAWTYGLAELPGARALISASERVANPGCYATAVALALAPILGSRLGDPREVVVVAASGTSGAGRKAVEGLLASEIMGSMSAYKVGGVHQHIPEMEQSLSEVASGPVRLSFTPLLAPMPRGILATCTVAVTQDASTQMVRACLDEAYRDEEFVHLLPEGAWPRTSSVLGSNGAHLQGGYDEHAGRIVVVIAIDNLGKGAAGQAVQNANLMLGLPEGAALGSIGLAP